MKKCTQIRTTNDTRGQIPIVDQLSVSLTRWYTAIVFVWTGKWAASALWASLLEFTGTHKNDQHTTWGVKLKYILVFNLNYDTD